MWLTLCATYYWRFSHCDAPGLAIGSDEAAFAASQTHRMPEVFGSAIAQSVFRRQGGTGACARSTALQP